MDPCSSPALFRLRSWVRWKLYLVITKSRDAGLILLYLSLSRSHVLPIVGGCGSVSFVPVACRREDSCKCGLHGCGCVVGAWCAAVAFLFLLSFFWSWCVWWGTSLPYCQYSGAVAVFYYRYRNCTIGKRWGGGDENSCCGCGSDRPVLVLEYLRTLRQLLCFFGGGVDTLPPIRQCGSSTSTLMGT